MVYAPSPSTIIRIALGVCRCDAAHSPGSNNCIPKYIAGLACIFSKVCPGLANTNTRRSAFSIGVKSPACKSSGLISAYFHIVGAVCGRGLFAGITPRKLGHKGTRFNFVNASRYSCGKSSNLPSSVIIYLPLKLLIFISQDNF